MPRRDQLQVTVSPMELMKHTEVLLHLLRRAFERPSATGTEQDRYMLALRGVAEFLDAIGAKELYGERFGKLAIAISDLESGRVAPVISPSLFGKGRPPDGSEAWIRRALVALAVEALLLSGSKRAGAAREIVRSFPAVANLARAKSPSKSLGAVLSWCESFRRGKVKNRNAVAIYRHILDPVKTEIAKDPQLVSRIVDGLLQRAVGDTSSI
jgi:hypothetical protein